MYQYFLFDLDGTLTDPGLGITNSVMYALKKYGIEIPDRSELYKFIGPPLMESFQRFYGFTEAQSVQATAYFREYFSTKGIFENELLADIDELLKTLRDNGKKIILATSKPEVFARKILQHFSIDQYFDFISGATMDEKRCEKAEVIQYVFDHYEIPDRSQAVMIGDRLHDICGAKSNGLDSIGVLFGYGTREELQEAGANYIVEKPLDILRYL